MAIKRFSKSSVKNSKGSQSLLAGSVVVNGGTLASDSTYNYRIFTGSGTLSVSGGNLSCDILVVAGGGPGGAGGGGGAGGVIYGDSKILKNSYTVTVGAGGPVATGNAFTTVRTNGNNSTFIGGVESLTGVGGGGGNGGVTPNEFIGRNGGSGGGGGPNTGTGQSTVGGSATQGGSGGPGYGFAGGGPTSTNNSGSGGGGAGGIGATAASSVGGNGGTGSDIWSSWLSAITSTMSGVSGWGTATSTGRIAGGGAGRGFNTPQPTGGAGGGGNGDRGDNSGNFNTGSAGVANTGGGGGAGYFASSHFGYAGGSGIVIVRYLKSAVA
jgi:hypothetical protein